MSNSRFLALDTVINRSNEDIDHSGISDQPISSFFGSNVFSDIAMREYLPEEAYLQVKSAMEAGTKLNHEIANTIAKGMQKWAMDKGATHYAHWFQPLTGRTAEKHDSFFTLTPDGEIVEEFDGKALFQQEPDGSSFPGGGLRSTFEARGYTAWDPSSPAFVYDTGMGKTLCIPTIFVTYSGEALDYKLPLLRSQSYLEKAALKVCQLFDKDVTRVYTTLGWEQEYFLVDEALYEARPDLVMTGRTLIGKFPAKGQQLDDHYFGSIPERILIFMRDLETECHKLGIPVRTRHNEVAPGQYELAPIFEKVNVAVDHNQLLLDLMERVAKRHKLRVLLHEKPFAGINGSGKHNNWSLATNTGRNLLSPGKDPGKNLRFLTFFVNTIKGVCEYADLLRASMASASNDHRLGANEAPPAIISVFVGSEMTKVLNALARGGSTPSDVDSVLDLLENLPNLVQDNTDRNRTSPFAFTGNKFEIRAVGSDSNCASPMLTLNTIMGYQLNKFYEDYAKELKKTESSNEAILNVLRRYVRQSKKILFEGNNYSDHWKEEAERRGLSNFLNTPEALETYMSSKVKKLFSAAGVMTDKELNAHYNVMMDTYATRMAIESRTLEDLCYTYVVPASIKYQTALAQSIAQMRSIDMPASSYDAQTRILKSLAGSTNQVNVLLNKMHVQRKKAGQSDTTSSAAHLYCQEVKPLMDEIRERADKVEHLVDDSHWTLPKYRELLFMK